MALPSIVSDIFGCNEIIFNDKNGKIIPPKNEDALLLAMQYFLNNPSEIRLMASNARSMIVDRYEQKLFWETMLEEYKRVESRHLKKT